MSAMQGTKTTRRKALTTVGTAALGGTLATLLTADTARAQVSGEFTIPDSSRALTDQQLNDIRLTADVSWSYDSNARISGVELKMLVGPTPDNLSVIARMEDMDINSDQLSGQDTLTGSIIQGSSYDTGDFTPSSGELSTSVIAALELDVYRDGQIVAEARSTESFTITIREEELTVTTQVGGSGEVSYNVS